LEVSRRAAVEVRAMTAAARAELYAELLGNVEELGDDDLATLIALEQVKDSAAVTRFPIARIQHQGDRPGIELAGQTYRTFKVVILDHQKRRALWARGEDAGKVPVCSSQDGQVPVAEVDLGRFGLGFSTGPACATCRMNAWGSDGVWSDQPGAGAGKACKEQRLLGVLVEGHDLPALLFLPPSSLKPFETYLSESAFHSRPLIRSYVELRVERVSAGGQEYGVLALDAGEPVSPADLRRIFALKRELAAAMAATTMDAAAENVVGVDEHGRPIHGEVDEDAPELSDEDAPVA
jgi:hypothetical protein